MAFKVDTKDVQKLVDALRDINRTAYPLAVRSTLNRVAFETRKLSSTETIPHTFTTRNTFIEKSVQYERSENTFSIGSMEARAGQVSDYLGKKTDQLDKQEHGSPVVAKGNYTFAATPTARGGNYNKPIAKRNLLTALNVKKLEDIVENPTTETHKEIRQSKAFATTKGKKINVLLSNAKGRKGIYTISKNSVSLLYRLNDKTNRIKQRKWLEPSVNKVMKKAEDIYVDEAKKRIEKEFAKKLKRS